ncbi:MAG: helix-turn-helix transcriptional regulator [Gordonia sp. (in: high G+C Gram-positive bacteria)]|uniref:helix-turn-helix domain-containing protein n=1 Tax=Gordonia sp. (in: high G+C Gram-positive bacteria) TaxID=84139 RepID=UPI0039E614A6
MNNSNVATVGQVIRQYREANNLSGGEAARRSGVAQSTITRLESGEHSPSIEKLTAIAAAVGAPMTEIFAAINMLDSDDLPALTPYLRTKYKHLPPAAHREIAAHFAKVANDYGISERGGPQPGEDE